MGCRTAGGLHTKTSEVWRNTRGSQFHAPSRESMQENRMKTFDVQGQVELLKRQVSDGSIREKKLKEKHDNLYIKYSEVCLENRMLTEQIFELEGVMKDRAEMMDLEKVISDMREKIQQLEQNQDHLGVKDYFEIERKMAEEIQCSMENILKIESILTSAIAIQDSLVNSSQIQSSSLCEAFCQVSYLEDLMSKIVKKNKLKQLDYRREIETLLEANINFQRLLEDFRAADTCYNEKISEITKFGAFFAHFLSEYPNRLAEEASNKFEEERRALETSVQELKIMVRKEQVDKEALVQDHRAQVQRYLESEAQLKEMESAVKLLESDMSLKDHSLKELAQSYQLAQHQAEDNSHDQEELEKRCSEDRERIQELEQQIKALSCKKTKVTVVTPKIVVSLPNGQLQEQGHINLPNNVLKKLVAAELGYTPEVRARDQLVVMLTTKAGVVPDFRHFRLEESSRADEHCMITLEACRRVGFSEDKLTQSLYINFIDLSVCSYSCCTPAGASAL
eukprot:755149-Hanusia_phi.AAC.2